MRYSLSFAISAEGVEALWDDQYGRDKPGFDKVVWDDADNLPADIVYKRFDPPMTSLSMLRDCLGQHIMQCFLRWFEEVYIDAWLDPKSFAYDRLATPPDFRHTSSTM